MDLLRYESELLGSGKKLIAGTDEAGRGPLAGPVVTACVIMPLDKIIEGVNDSKKLSEKQREKLYMQIMETALDVAVQVVDHKTIDKINILNATKLGMVSCIEALKLVPDIVLVDAVKIKPNVETLSIIRGDGQSYSIAAASIIAKVYRDRLMKDLDKQYPVYGFAKHKGYATELHIERIRQNGLSEVHRKSFCRNFCGGEK